MIAVLRVLAWALAVALVMAPVVAVVNGWIGSERWPLRVLRVHGQFERVDEARLRETVLPYARDGFFAVDLDGARAAVAALPWVERAEVRKRWPDVLEVRVVEHMPFAHWGDDRVLSGRGLLFPAQGIEMPPGLPRLEGPDARVREVVALYNEAQALFAAGGARLAAVALDRRGSWSLTLADGTEVVVGRQDARPRLARFARAMPRLLAERGEPLARADLRYTNGFALVWGEVAAQPDGGPLRISQARSRHAPPPQPVRPAGLASWRSSAHGPVVRKRASSPPASGGGISHTQGTT
ncbi:MAG: cell division protein FtsQ/DivIB [Gammaproteobacteria bacterium]